MPDVRGGLLARQPSKLMQFLQPYLDEAKQPGLLRPPIPTKEPRSTLGSLEATLNAVSPVGLLNTFVVNPVLAGAQAFQKGATTGELSGGDVLAMGAPAMTGGLLAPPGGVGLGSGPFYSKLAQTVHELPLGAAKGKQWLGTLKNAPGIKPEEMEWTGLGPILENQADVTLTKKEVVDFLNANKVDVQEVLLGKPPKPIKGAVKRTVGPQIKDLFTGRMRVPRIEPRATPEEIATVTDRSQNDWRTLQDELAAAFGPEDRELAGRTNPTFPRAGPLVDRIRAGDQGAATEAALMLQRQARSVAKEAKAPVKKTKYERYTMPGGENYRELLLTMPPRSGLSVKDFAQQHGYSLNDTLDPSTPAGASWNAYVKANKGGPKDFQSGHFDEPNILTHVRFKDRVDTGGKKTLFIEEIQSDWHQKGRESGYGPWKFGTPEEQQAATGRLDAARRAVNTTRTADPNWPAATAELHAAEAAMRDTVPGWGRAEYGGVPDAPFKTSWPELALKRMVKWASDHGYDQLAWTPGKVQADRYNLSTHVDEINWQPGVAVPDSKIVKIIPTGSRSTISLEVTKDGHITSSQGGKEFEGHNLGEVVGKDIAVKIMQSAGKDRLAGEGLKIGGQGMKAFYDKILPNTASKLFNKAQFGNAKVGVTRVPREPESPLVQDQRTGLWRERTENDPRSPYGEEVWSLPITKEMRGEAKEKGLPLFSGRAPGLSGLLGISEAEGAERPLPGGWRSLLGPIKEGEALARDPIGPGRLAPGGGGLLGAPTVLRSKPPLKGELDPHGISGVKLPKPWSEIEYTRVPNMSLAPKNVMSPTELYAKHKGGVLLPVVGDKATAGERVIKIEGVPVDVQTLGGGAYMRLGQGGVWASELSKSSALSKQIEKVKKKFDTDDVLITHATMGPKAIDFSQHPTKAILDQLPTAKISRAGAKAVKERMEQGIVETTTGGSKRYQYPDFPGIHSPKLADWLAASGNRRKHFVKLMDNAEMQKVGVPHVGAARLATTDVEQLGVPWMSSGMNISRVQSGLLSGEPTHPAFPVKTPGEYEGSLGRYVPVDVMFRDWFLKNRGKQNPLRAFELGGADRAQPINQRWLDRLMTHYSRSR